MYIFRNIMCIKKGNISICCDLDIHIHLGSEKTSFKKVYSSDARYLEDLSLHEFLSFCITGMIYHLVNGIPENVDRCLGDHNADHDTGDRVQDRVSQSCTEDADKRSDRGKCIWTMVPCICHQGSWIDLLCSTSCIPEHPLFYHNGYHCCNQCKCSRNGNGSAGCAFYDITGTGNSDPETSDKQHSCKDNGRNTLHSFMSVLVLFVRFLCRKTDTDNYDEGASHIWCRMNGIRDHRSWMCHNTCDQFKYR